MIFGTALAALAALAATPASAQDGSEAAMNRTPANAQKFLAALPPAGFFSEGKWHALSAGLISFNGCKTDFQGFEADLVQKNVTPKSQIIEHASVDWSKAQEVTLEPFEGMQMITIFLQDVTQLKQFNMIYATQTSAQRVLAAAQYLQSACDKTRDLGF
jgi:hypothetical protein